MFLGHYGVALASKRAAPATSLGALVLAAQLPDLLWPIFLIAGIEEVRIVPGLLAASPLDFVSYPISHSLVMDVAWGALLALIFWLVRRDRRGAIALVLLVVSHWLLDLPMHRPDLPLLPLGGPKVGLGGWRSVPFTLAIETLFFVIGIVVYAGRTRPCYRMGRWLLIGFVVLLAAAYASSLGAPPPSETALAWGALSLWITPVFAAWVDRHRAESASR